MALDIKDYQRRLAPRLSDVLPLQLLRDVLQRFQLSSQGGIAFMVRAEDPAPTQSPEHRLAADAHGPQCTAGFEFWGDDTRDRGNAVCQCYFDATGAQREGCLRSDARMFVRCENDPPIEATAHRCWLGFDEYAHVIKIDGRVCAMLVAGQLLPDEPHAGALIERTIEENVPDVCLAQRMREALSVELGKQRSSRWSSEHTRTELNAVASTLQSLTDQLTESHRREATSRLVAEISDYLVQTAHDDPNAFWTRCEAVLAEFCSITGLRCVYVLWRRSGRYHVCCPNGADQDSSRIRSGEILSQVPVSQILDVDAVGEEAFPGKLRQLLERKLPGARGEPRLRLYRHDTTCPPLPYSVSLDAVLSTVVVLVGNCTAALESTLEAFCRTVSLRFAIAGLAFRMMEAQASYAQHVRRIGHSIRTPLQCAMFDLDEFASALRAFPDLVLRLRESQNYLFDAHEDLTHLVESSVVYRTQFDLVALLDQLMASLCPLATAQAVSIVRWDSWPHEVLVEADRAAIRRGLLAILENAVKYSFRKMDVRVELLVTAQTARISVSNFGIGIPEDVIRGLLDGAIGLRARIEDEGGSGRERAGTGTGVYTALSAFRKEGGDLSIESHRATEGDSAAEYHRHVTQVTAFLPLTSSSRRKRLWENASTEVKR